jgi:hypothetical protein
MTPSLPRFIDDSGIDKSWSLAKNLCDFNKISQAKNSRKINTNINFLISGCFLRNPTPIDGSDGPRLLQNATQSDNLFLI